MFSLNLLVYGLLAPVAGSLGDRWKPTDGHADRHRYSRSGYCQLYFCPGASENNRLRLEELWQKTNNIMQGVRRLSQDLRPAALDRLGLLSALEWLASDVSEYSGIEIKVNVLGNERRLPEEVELVLFRITQEALRNVWRHSQATRAKITVEFDESKTRVTVSDNGKGFKLPQTIGDLARDGKLGLAGMQERARLLGGSLTVQSEPGRGSTITVELPA